LCTTSLYIIITLGSSLQRVSRRGTQRSFAVPPIPPILKGPLVYMECDVSRTDSLHERGMFLDFYFQASTLFNTASTSAPHGSTVSEDAGIEPRTVATLALSVRYSNRSTISQTSTIGYTNTHKSNLLAYTHKENFSFVSSMGEKSLYFLF
jgi:hypothetical protein